MSLLTRHRLRFAGIASLAAVLALCAAVVQAEPLVPVPALAARVTDLTGTLTPDQVAALDSKLSAFESAKGSQVAVLVVPTTLPEEIEQYAIRVADAWKLGRKGVDDGAILLVAHDDRKVRIEVGYGLEGVLPDATANRIIDEDIVPRFRNGDYYGGIDTGVDRMVQVIEGEPLPEPARRGMAGGTASGLGNLLPVLLVFALVGGAILRRLFGRVAGALATGGLVGFITWLIIGIIAMSIFAGVIAFIFAVVGGGTGGGPGGRGWYSHRRGGGTGFPGSFGGGGFGGGGGGFSGGGGGFGGGGASGSW
ncbi:MAG: YgcG family protein [Steroidobacteraceae bacterium]|nr:YgcG family protein [Steroidobacteraceae bacterium]